MDYVRARFIGDICFVLFTTTYPRRKDTERTGVAVALWARIRETLASNIGPGIGYLSRGFLCIS
jgi:hypothetical protein